MIQKIYVTSTTAKSVNVTGENLGLTKVNFYRCLVSSPYKFIKANFFCLPVIFCNFKHYGEKFLFKKNICDLNNKNK